MTGKLSRNALELVATFAAGGIALNRPQQHAVGKLCRAAATIKRLAIEECNGDWPLRKVDQDAWRAELDKRRAAAKSRILDMIAALPEIKGAKIGGDPRGATVKLVMDKEHEHLHDDMGRKGICVPGS